MDLNDLLKLAGITVQVTPVTQPEASVEEADGAGFDDATTRPEPAIMDDPMQSMGSDADLSLRRYLKAKGDHVTVDEADLYPDLTVEDVSESYAAFKEAKAKPDYIDIDGDGDKEEPMKKAIKDKEEANESVEEEVEESTDDEVEESADLGWLKTLAGLK